jgi:hypothetical protein
MEDQEGHIMNPVLCTLSRVIGWIHARQQASGVDPEAGQVINEWLGLSALAIAAIVVIGAALQVLGVDVVNWIRTQLGIGG